jgi:hypothetical protein
MNIFYLHHSALMAASMHCDKHVVKMILETAQMMSTIYHLHGESDKAPYKKTHEHHPCVKWAASNKANYSYLAELGYHLCNQYARRYGRRHACEVHIKQTLAKPPAALAAGPYKWTEPPQAMPEDCQIPGNPVEAYRKYYRKYKAAFATWKFGEMPRFMLEQDLATT